VSHLLGHALHTGRQSYIPSQEPSRHVWFDAGTSKYSWQACVVRQMSMLMGSWGM
jgi:hypothetical protein